MKKVNLILLVLLFRTMTKLDLHSLYIDIYQKKSAAHHYKI